MVSIPELIIRPEHWQQMLAHVSKEAPNEACGLIGGSNGSSLEVFETPNQFNSPTRFRIPPQKQLQILNILEKRQWDLLGIYHSHPTGPSTPSATDIAEAYDTKTVNLIWSQSASKWGCRGFIIANNRIKEVTISLSENL